VGDIGDGRLELDELGSVIDHASSLDVPRRAELLEGNDTTTWGERLENAGVTPWLRRHRVAIAAGTAAVLLLGAAGTAWVRTRPPQQITTVDVLVTEIIADGGQSGIVDTGSGILQSSYRVTPQRSGDTVRILGVVGPGIRASKVRSHSDKPAEDGTSIADVAVVLGCDDPALDTMSPKDFRLRVEETDTYGRTTSGSVDLPFDIASQLADDTVAPCNQQQISESIVPTKVVIGGSLPARTITATVTVHNGFGHGVSLSPPQGQQSSVYVAGGTTQLGTGDDAVVPVSLRVSDCSNPRVDDAYVPDTGQGGSTSTPGVNLLVTRNDLQQGFGATIVVPFAPVDRARIRSLLEQMCRGVPSVTTRVVIAGSSPVAPTTEFTSSGDPSTVGLRMTVDVATTAQRVVLSDGVAPEDVAQGADVTISTAGSPVKQGHARLVVDWAVACGGGVVNPPTVQLELTSGSRSWPVRAILADEHLLAAYRVACPELQSGDFEGLGWPGS